MCSEMCIRDSPDPAIEGVFTYTDDMGVVQTVAAGAVLSPTEAATLMFEPVMDFNGMVATVMYTVTDVNGETSDANIDIVVGLAPDATDDLYSGNEDTPVVLDPLANDDVGDAAESVEILNVPDPVTEGSLTYTDDLTGNILPVVAGSVLTPAEAATLMFNPVMDFNGPVSTIGYEVTDTDGESSQAVIDINIIPTPDAMDDLATTNEDTPVNVNPLTNDDDGAGVQSVTVDTIPDPAEGELTYLDASGNPVTVMPGDVLTPEQAATLTFVPAEDFNGTVPPIDYTLTDINGEESSAQILIEITPTPDAVDDPFTTNEDTPVLLAPLANDDLGAGAESLTINNVPDPATEGELTYTDENGEVQPVAPGDILTPEQAATLTFTPVEDFNGTVPPVNYTVTDVNGETSDAHILIEVLPTPDAVDDVNATSADTPVEGNVLTNDFDDPAENLMVTMVNGMPIGNGPIATDCGTLEINPDGSYTFTPLPGMAGTDSFTYTIEDEFGNESQATVTIGIADLAIAKEVVGTPVLLGDGNYEATYQIVVLNNGAFDLDNLSLVEDLATCLLYTSPSPRDLSTSRMPSSA